MSKIRLINWFACLAFGILFLWTINEQKSTMLILSVFALLDILLNIVEEPCAYVWAVILDIFGMIVSFLDYCTYSDIKSIVFAGYFFMLWVRNCCCYYFAQQYNVESRSDDEAFIPVASAPLPPTVPMYRNVPRALPIARVVSTL